MKNDVHCGLAYCIDADTSSDSWVLHLERGDYVQCKGAWSSDRTYGGFFVERC